MFASFDPVALDMACADACNKQPVVHGSVLEEQMQHVHEKDHFHILVHPDTNWESCVEHAEKNRTWNPELRVSPYLNEFRYGRDFMYCFRFLDLSNDFQKQNTAASNSDIFYFSYSVLSFQCLTVYFRRFVCIRIPFMQSVRDS